LPIMQTLISEKKVMKEYDFTYFEWRDFKRKKYHSFTEIVFGYNVYYILDQIYYAFNNYCQPSYGENDYV